MQPDSNSQLSPQVRQLTLLYDALPTTLIATLVNAFVLFFILYHDNIAMLAELWLGSMIVVLIMRFIIYFRFKRSNLSSTPFTLWDRLFLFGLAMTSLHWVAGVFIFFNVSEPHEQLFLAFILAGLTAGAIAIALYRFIFYIVYSAPILIALSLAFFVYAEELGFFLGGMVILFALVMFNNAKRIYTTSAASSALVQHNEALLADLQRERKRVNTALDQMKRANHTKDLLINNLSHEIRTPLNAIMGFSQLLHRDSRIPQHAQKMTEAISTSGKRLLTLVEILILYSKIETRTQVYKPVTLDLNSIIRQHVNEQLDAMEKKQIVTTIKIEPRTMLHADNTLFGTLIRILLSYIIDKAHFHTPILIEHSHDGIALHLNFYYRGTIDPMLSPELLFDLDFHLDGSFEHRNLEQGIGLLIVKKIITDFHKGSIENRYTDSQTNCISITIAQHL